MLRSICFKFFSWAPLLVLGAALPLAAQEKKVELNPVEFKAAFLSKIPPYINWPAASFTNAEAPIILGILGGDPVGEILDQLLKDKKVNGREVVVRPVKDGSEIAGCHILFVPSAQTALWLELRKTLDPAGLLTIGESNDFFQTGGVFSLSAESRKLKVNLGNAKKARLEVNSKLLKIASVEK